MSSIAGGAPRPLLGGAARYALQRLVRHPGYLAAIVGALVTPLLLGSAWAFAPAVAVAVLFVVRIGLEDAFLRRDLPGYAEHAARTRHRLVPFVWQAPTSSAWSPRQAGES